MGGSITKTTKNSQMDIGRFEGKKTFCWQKNQL